MNTTNKIKALRLFRSPFMISSLAGVLALLLSFIWVYGSYAAEFNGFLGMKYVYLILINTLPVVIGLVILAMFKYMSNGYMSKECVEERSHRRKTLAKNKLLKIINKEHYEADSRK